MMSRALWKREGDEIMVGREYFTLGRDGTGFYSVASGHSVTAFIMSLFL